jgi:hypothetical protein
MITAFCACPKKQSAMAADNMQRRLSEQYVRIRASFFLKKVRGRTIL